MKNLKSVEDFVLDAEFRAWVLDPSPSANVFWDKWLNANPEKKENLLEAVRLVQLMGRVDYVPEPEFTKSVWEKIEATLDPCQKSEKESVPLNIQSVAKKAAKKSGSGRLNFLISFAASVALLITPALVTSQSLKKDKERRLNTKTLTMKTTTN